FTRWMRLVLWSGCLRVRSLRLHRLRRFYRLMTTMRMRVRRMKTPKKFEARGWVEVNDDALTRTEDGASESRMRIRGYAVVFNSPSERMGRWVETIDPRAFDDVLAADPDVRLLRNHSGL